MTELQKNELIALTNELIAVPHCCGELKDAGKAWIAALGTEGEKAASEAFVKELEEDVMSVDDTIAFFITPKAVAFFGPQGAAEKLEGLKQHKANGGKYCNCAACAAGAAILEMKDILLG